MRKLLNQYSNDDLLNFLWKSKQVDIKIDSISEICNDYNSNEKFLFQTKRKRFFHLKSIDSVDYHLSIGQINRDAWTNACYAQKTFREMVCVPFFYGKLGNYNFLIQEYFNGIPIDLALKRNFISQDQVSLILHSIDESFQETIKESTYLALETELNKLKDDLLSSLEFSDIDICLIDSLISFILDEKLNTTKKYTKRWSCGDFVARNILISKAGNFKLIDFEWSKFTHFYQEDWLRLFLYSKEPFKTNTFLRKKKPTFSSALQTYFWLRQITLDSNIHSGESLVKYLNFNLKKALTSPECYNLRSHFLGPLTKQITSLERYQFIHSFLHDSHSKSILTLDSKVRRMENSFSWRVTSPVRYIRRKFFDHRKLERRGQYCISKKHYRNWIRKFDEIGFLKKRSFKQKLKRIEYQPLVSIILPVYDPEKCFFEQTLFSVLNQLYQNWELCICNDGSTNPQIQNTIEEFTLKDDRIKHITLNSNMHISYASNQAAKLAEGEYITFLDHDDLLRPHTLYKFIESINHDRGLKFIYSDEDKIDEMNQRYDHYFKPDWNPDLLLSQNYICHMVFCRMEVFRNVNGFRQGFEGSQDWDLFLRITEKLKTEEIGHVPQVLYHWRSTENSTATSLSTKKYVIPRSLLSVNEALKRRKVEATAKVDDRVNGYLRVHFHIPKKQPLVSILIPTKNHFELITRCVESILSNTDYDNYEIIILDNDTTCELTLEYFSKIESIKNISIKKISCPFNYSYINNLGVKYCSGKILAFVNNDIEAISNEWLGEMVSHAIRPGIGCVGSKLLYPDNHIQHAGVVLGIGGIAGHGQKHFPSWNDGYKHRLKVVQNYEAVTAACMLLEKKIFNKVGGFDEENLKIAYNDVDLCIKVREAGFLNLWTPYALLKHHESASRGFDKDPVGKARFDKEKEYMKKKWAHKFLADPAYNPNLSLKHEDFSLNYRLNKKKS